ncbi:terminase [Romboutsia maritimum]|uniref:Terminase n=1 Tax=Romboutsia maritimum TaxID=2020948 RepID=A0A371IQ44_9FIRM|nr:phage terminase small subunit [Romboutsia maritimum]RDY22596.1 terminase [Romboutsia maritimum]
MARVRSPNRDKAFEIYKEHNGNIDLVEIAKLLNISPGTIRGWKNKDTWEDKINGTFRKNKERSEKKKGGHVGNKNATGPPGNKHAVTTGEFESIFFDTLEEDELKLAKSITFEKMKLLEQEIQLLTVRERRMLKRIEDSKEKEMTLVSSKSGIEKGMDTDISEFEGTLGQIQNIEDALTRVQDKKQKAIDSLHKYEMDELKANMDKEKLELDKYKTLGDEEGDNNDAIQNFLKATSMSKEDIKALFDDEGDENGTT